MAHLITFHAVEAARDPLVQKELTKMAWEAGDIRALTHALKIIAQVRGAAGTDTQAM